MESQNVTATAVSQHMRALQRANVVRLARAELKRAIARGEVDAAEVVRDCPWETESMTIAELLTSQRRWGRTRARKLLMPLSLSENKRLGTLTALQRRLLAEQLAKESSAPARSSSLRNESDRTAEGLWDELAAVSRRSEDLAGELSHLTERRDELIRSLSETGAPRRAVAEAASLTVGRVQQIVDESAKSRQGR